MTMNLASLHPNVGDGNAGQQYIRPEEKTIKRDWESGRRADGTSWWSI